VNEQYLWDKSGTPDPEIERLETLLGELRHRERPLRAGAAARRPAFWFPAAAAAAVLIACAGSLIYRASPAALSSTWEISDVQGGAHVDGQAAREAAKLRTGETLRTEASGRATLESDAFGQVKVDPGSALQLTQSTASRQALHLSIGMIHALIWSPPGEFAVDTPNARAIDLGCKYTLSVDGAGEGLIQVEFGWVAFRSGTREAFIPAGAFCRTSKAGGPATPFYEDASEEFKRSLDQFDASGDHAALVRVLASARAKDGLTLWHLLERSSAADRGAVFDRFAQLIGTPAGVSREGVLAGDRRMLDLCWNALDLEDASWWRKWEQKWQAEPGN
jgi:hypothetical protein